MRRQFQPTPNWHTALAGYLRQDRIACHAKAAGGKRPCEKTPSTGDYNRAPGLLHVLRPKLDRITADTPEVKEMAYSLLCWCHKMQAANFVTCWNSGQNDSTSLSSHGLTATGIDNVGANAEALNRLYEDNRRLAEENVDLRHAISASGSGNTEDLNTIIQQAHRIRQLQEQVTNMNAKGTPLEAELVTMKEKVVGMSQDMAVRLQQGEKIVGELEGNLDELGRLIWGLDRSDEDGQKLSGWLQKLGTRIREMILGLDGPPRVKEEWPAQVREEWQSQVKEEWVPIKKEE